LGAEHFAYLSALNNLGLVYQDTREYDAAETLHQKSARGSEEHGRRDATFGTTLNNLAA